MRSFLRILGELQRGVTRVSPGDTPSSTSSASVLISIFCKHCKSRYILRSISKWHRYKSVYYNADGHLRDPTDHLSMNTTARIFMASTSTFIHIHTLTPFSYQGRQTQQNVTYLFLSSLFKHNLATDLSFSQLISNNIHF